MAQQDSSEICNLSIELIASLEYPPLKSRYQPIAELTEMKRFLTLFAPLFVLLNITACAGLYNTTYNDNWDYSERNKDGQLSRQEWSIYMDDRYVKTATERGYANKSEFDDAAFKTADKDTNGFISRPEYDQFVSEATTNSYFPTKR
ncbi:EF-hand domain-containing protein [Pseudomonas antarctica]|nr:hypothetical protein [Pseudomonas antarctica]